MMCRVYEALTRREGVNPLKGKQNVLDLATGKVKYPWEDKKRLPREWRHSRARPIVEMCLKRDPEERASAQALLAEVRRAAHNTQVRLAARWPGMLLELQAM